MRQYNTEEHAKLSEADWLELRKKDVTASEIASLFGASAFRTHLDTWLEKKSGKSVQIDSDVMRRGRLLEPGILVGAKEDNPGWEIRPFAPHGERRYFRIPALRIGATPDFELIRPDRKGKGVIEAKSVMPGKFEEDWADGPPLGYLLQTMAQMMAVNADFGVLAVMIDNFRKDLICYDIERNDQVEEKIIDGVGAFWDSIDAGAMPAPDYARDRSALKALYPAPLEKRIDLMGNNALAAALAKRELLKAQGKEIESEIVAIENALIHAMGVHEEAFLPGFKATYKLQERKGYEVKPASFRVLRISSTKD